MLDSVFLTSTYSHSSTSSIGFSFFFRCFWASSWSSVKRIHRHLSNQNTNPPLNPSVTPVMLPYKMADGYWAALLPAHEWAGNRLSPEQRWPSLQTLPLQKSVDSIWRQTTVSSSQHIIKWGFSWIFSSITLGDLVTFSLFNTRSSLTGFFLDQTGP